MNHDELIHHRLTNQKLTGHTASVRDIVHHMGAMQAQDYYGALWSIGVRTGKTQAEVIASLESAEVIRTWPQRGTLHYVTPEDARWMLALSAPKLLAGASRRREFLGITEDFVNNARSHIEAQLSGGKRLTRQALLTSLEEAGFSTKDGKGYHLLWYASQTGVTYIGAMEGKQQTFGLLTDVAPHSPTFSPEEAATELAQRYFTSHGPATIQDFIWWSGMPAALAKTAVAACTPDLVKTTIDGKEYLSGPLSTSSPATPAGLLLAGFDEYILGYKIRDAQLKPEYFSRIVPGSNGMFMATVVRDGHVIGTWKAAQKKKAVHISLTPFIDLTSKDTDALAKSLTEYGKFLGLEAHLDVKS